MSVHVCVRALKGKRVQLATPNLVENRVNGSRSECTDVEVKRLQMKVTRLCNALPVGVGMQVETTASDCTDRCSRSVQCHSWPPRSLPLADHRTSGCCV